VLEIVDPRVYRFIRCRDEFRTRFPDRTDFQVINVARRGWTTSWT
jgi:hypothetical protein